MPAQGKKMEKKITRQDIFKCAHWECFISKKDCLKRQQKKGVTLKSYWGSKTQAAFPDCQGCLQGLQIRLEEMLPNGSRDPATDQ